MGWDGMGWARQPDGADLQRELGQVPHDEEGEEQGDDPLDERRRDRGRDPRGDPNCGPEESLHGALDLRGEQRNEGLGALVAPRLGLATAPRPGQQTLLPPHEKVLHAPDRLVAEQVAQRVRQEDIPAGGHVAVAWRSRGGRVAVARRWRGGGVAVAWRLRGAAAACSCAQGSETHGSSDSDTRSRY